MSFSEAAHNAVLKVETALHNLGEHLHELKSHLSPEVQADVKAVQNMGHEAVSEAWKLIKTEGWQDAYQIVTGIVLSAVTGAHWGDILATALKAVIDAGHQLKAHEVAILAAQAQADLIAVGKLAAPALAGA